MNSSPPAPLVWWLIWAAITATFFAAIGILEFTAINTATPRWLSLAALVPLASSAVVRFLILPRTQAPHRRFLFFILGLALAESGGFIALVLASPWKTPLAAAAIVLMILHIPANILNKENIP